MAKFIIEPHFRLHEWVAEEKGYFREEGLDYEFRELVRATGGKIHDKGDKVGAYQSFEEGRKSNVSCACHWTVNVAASKGIGRMYTDAYSVSPAGIFVQPNSNIKSPADLAGVPISVGYQSGSNYATVQALEPYLKPDQIKLNFADGMLFKRMEQLVEGKAPAVSLFSGPYYFAEQLGKEIRSAEQRRRLRLAVDQLVEPVKQHAVGIAQIGLVRRHVLLERLDGRVMAARLVAYRDRHAAQVLGRLDRRLGRHEHRRGGNRVRVGVHLGVALGCGDVDGPVAGAAHVAVAARFDVLVGADLVRRGVRVGEVLAFESLAELVIEAFGLEIALFLRNPLMQAEVRRY